MATYHEVVLFAKENVKPANRRHIIALSLPFGQLSFNGLLYSFDSGQILLALSENLLIKMSKIFIE